MLRPVLLVAGGTGGHLFPALALREALSGRGITAHIATDERVGAYVQGVSAGEAHTIASATIAGGNPIRLVGSAIQIIRGTITARRLISRLDPSVIVGFGGYPTVPPILAARSMGRPALVHEQNAVLGRANRLLLRVGAALATGFPDPAGAGHARVATFVGNPVRSNVREAARLPYRPSEEGGAFRLLVFGGSQGAHFFSDFVPALIDQFPDRLRDRLELVQQCRQEDMHEVRAALDRRGVSAELAPFFNDLADRIATSHLVIARAGASTVSELAVIGRPAILVPYPHALDHDQAANAAALARSGGAMVRAQADLVAADLARTLTEMIGDPAKMAEMAAAAKAVGAPDAVDKLADLVERMADSSVKDTGSAR